MKLTPSYNIDVIATLFEIYPFSSNILMNLSNSFTNQELRIYDFFFNWQTWKKLFWTNKNFDFFFKYSIRKKNLWKLFVRQIGEDFD